MYLPKTKYSKPEYTRGDTYVLPSGKYYTGWYFETYDGRYFTGKVPSKTSELLQQENQSDAFTPLNRFVNDLIIPSTKDYEAGYITRYYLQDKRNKSIIEVKQKKYQELIKRQYITGTHIKWNLSKPAENKNVGPYVYFGSAAKNKELVLDAEKIVPGLSNTIKNYGEFVK